MRSYIIFFLIFYCFTFQAFSQAETTRHLKGSTPSFYYDVINSATDSSSISKVNFYIEVIYIILCKCFVLSMFYDSELRDGL